MGWAARFEAYTPDATRVRGHYGLPLLWRAAVLGWGNVWVQGGVLVPEIGYLSGRAPRDGVFRRELEAELERMRRFLRLAPES